MWNLQFAPPAVVQARVLTRLPEATSSVAAFHVWYAQIWPDPLPQPCTVSLSPGSCGPPPWVEQKYTTPLS